MYFIVEIQKAADGTSTSITNTAADINHADQTYHQILSYAAVSSLPCHSVIMFTDDGDPVKHEAYWHAQPEPEVESEAE